MNRTLTKLLLFALAGGLALLLLQWHFSYSWATYYSRFPWQGYQHAMQDGRVPAFLTGSPRSLLIGDIVIFSVSLLTLWFGRGISSALALWCGIMTALAAVWMGTPALRQDSNMWPIDLVFLAFCTGIPLWLGALLVMILRKVVGPRQERLV